MRDPRVYQEQADHARRLADITVQRNVEEILRRVAEELDRLADKMGPIPLIPRGWNACESFGVTSSEASSPMKLATGRE